METYKRNNITFERGEDGKWHPPMEPDEPRKPQRSHYDLEGTSKRKRIYHDVVVLGDSEIDIEEYFADLDRELPRPAKRVFQNLSLQDIVDLAPPGAKLSDIIFHMEYPRYIEYIEFSFDHIKRNHAAEEKAFQEAMKEYDREYAQYQQDLATYKKELSEHREWERTRKIKKLETQLAQLKK